MFHDCLPVGHPAGRDVHRRSSIDHADGGERGLGELGSQLAKVVDVLIERVLAFAVLIPQLACFVPPAS